MHKGLNSLFGFSDDTKRIYQMAEGEVSKDEFESSKILASILFGDLGYIDTLGPTWSMVHDPRFFKIEACFISKQPRFFKGSLDDLHTQSLNVAEDFEEYGEILGEGRHFCKVVRSLGFDPKGVFSWSSDFIWTLIHNECPNYFDKKGKPNNVAIRLYQLIQCDLLGLVDDYAGESNSVVWISVDTNEIVDINDPELNTSDTPTVFFEIDQLEKALTTRANLRAMAVKVLNSIGIDIFLVEGDLLTSIEQDQLMQKLYMSNWPEDRIKLGWEIREFIRTANKIPYEQRLFCQLESAQLECGKKVAGLRDGSIKPLTEESDGIEILPMTDEEKVMHQIMHDPIRQKYFLIAQGMEEQGEVLLSKYLMSLVMDINFDFHDGDNFAQVDAEIKKLLKTVQAQVPLIDSKVEEGTLIN